MGKDSRNSLKSPWRGVNLGGWLLLEPGPACGLFEEHLKKNGECVHCEYELMQILTKRKQLQALQHHRETHTTRRDFERIKELGLNAVRVPFGYWIVLGALKGDPYLGPGLEFLDKAIEWAEEFGLQVVLDLHGAPGGESADAPCGRRQRPESKWHWKHWRCDQSILALEELSKRYGDRQCVTGIEVCNEPSLSVPMDKLFEFYDRAISAIRSAGMPHSRVTVVLPCFQRDLTEFAPDWERFSGNRHPNVCFDLHYYHCFESPWREITVAQHLRAVEQHLQDELLQFPAMIGEWCLELGEAAKNGSLHTNLSSEQMRSAIGRAQRGAYDQASHGWFFWNWKDTGGVEWDYQQCHGLGAFEGPPMQLPPWDGEGVDPLELEFDPPLGDAGVCYGSAVYLRVFDSDLYVDVEGAKVRARWADRGEWQQLFFQDASAGAAPPRAGAGSVIANGDLVCLLTSPGEKNGGRYLRAAGRGGLLTARAGPADDNCAFVVHTQDDQSMLQHRHGFFLRSKATSPALCAKCPDGILSARSETLGSDKCLIVEQPRALVDPPEVMVHTIDLPQDLVVTTPARRPQRSRSLSDSESTKVLLPPTSRRRMLAPGVADASPCAERPVYKKDVRILSAN